MKRLFFSFLILGVISGTGHAECSYFRLSANLLKCESVDAKAMEAANPYQHAQDIPELQDPTITALVQVTCSCEYSLSGSDPRCDMDQSFEKSSILGADHPAESCRRGKILCRDVCPSRLP